MIVVEVRLFAMLRERAGRSRVQLSIPAGAPVSSVWASLGLGEEPPGLSYAVNRAYVGRDHPLAQGDEVALIPPVSGGSPEPYVELVDHTIDLGSLIARVAHPGAGAIATFQGTVRDSSHGKDVDRLEYEIYQEMALGELRRIAGAAAGRHDLLGIGIIHRGGRCEIGETTVAVACSAAHRAAALSACQETIDELKLSVPIWKKELYADGASWIGRGS